MHALNKKIHPQRLRSKASPAGWLRNATMALLSAVLTLPATVTTSHAENTAQRQPVSELEVKAALVYRVAKFITWPARAFGAPSDNFVACVVTKSTSIKAFDELEGKQLGTHRVIVRRISGDMLDLRQCHTVFFPADAGSDIDYALGKLEGAPVLTIGENEEFIRRGGMLALVTRDQRVKFTINLPASKRAGLEVSSQLLQLATVVSDAP